MEFRKGAEIDTSDFWYDLFEGGYIKPEELLVNQTDIDEILKARKILLKFYNESLDQEITNFI